LIRLVTIKIMKILGTAILLAWGACAQDPSPLQVQGLVQSNYVYPPSSAGGVSDSSLAFLKESGQARLTEATLTLTGDWGGYGFRIDGGAGDFYKVAMASDSWKGPNQYISQAYVFGKPFGDLPIRVEAGKFFSSVGAEVPQSSEDFNISRSLLFVYGSPVYHVGVQASGPVTSTITAGAQLLSGVNTVTGAHGHQTMAYTATQTEKRWGWSEIYMGGDEKFVGRGWRQLSDSVLTLSPSGKVSAYVEFLGALEKRVTRGYDRWFGFASAWKFSPIDKWSISPRVEWFDDPTGATSGTAQHVAEFTLTGEYRPTRFAIARLEYRADRSSMPFFPGTSIDAPVRGRQLLIAGITLVLKHGM